jgi:iron complex transport system ATP-binding protein
LHDINQALQGFERLILIKHGTLVGDYQTSHVTLPLLEALYGVRLASAMTEEGEMIVAPSLKQQRLSNSLS